ncbi:vertebrate ancient opsin-like [Spea bombifrons]|uniref:vertebrate ancient opsin-like n=1 Tax=Spea bombifrons TaxID=233779 RepID=UPI00234B6F48|nr:vertebrate ancient opsin-like [Spea bombifrons]
MVEELIEDCRGHPCDLGQRLYITQQARVTLHMAFPSSSPSCSDSSSVTCKSSSHQYGTEEQENLAPTGHLLVAVSLGIIGGFGFLNNLVVLVLFCQYKVLRSPINLLLMNISISDLMVCILGTPFSFAASTQGRWLIGKAGCIWYGFINALFGTVSLVSLAALSYERYCTMLGSTEADVTNFKKAWLGILVSWIYSLVWTLPPLFGWSSYGPEGPGTTCSVNWHSRDAQNTSYIVCLFIFCLALPFTVIVYCYGRLLVAIKQISGVTKGIARSREQRVLLMVIVMVVCFLLCWLPYGIMALIATFGKPGLITPSTSIIPSILAKSSTVYNPIIYIFLNKQFYRCFTALLKCSNVPQTSSNKGSSKITKICLTTRKPPNNITFNAASTPPPTSEEDKVPSTYMETNEIPANHDANYLQQKTTVTLVAHYIP